MIRIRLIVTFNAIATFLVSTSFAEQTESTMEESPQPVHVADFDISEASVVTSECSCGTFGCGGCADLCCSDLWQRDRLLGGTPGLAAHGIVPDIQWTQFYQDVAGGGARRNEEYAGKIDYMFTFLGAQMGLNEGLIVALHAETRYGRTVLRDATPLAPVNANLLYPSLNNETAITALQITQMLSPEWGITFGKINAMDFYYSLFPQTGRGIDGFMNGSMLLPLTASRTLPLAYLGAGVLKLEGTKIQGALLAYDSNNSATTSGFDNLFDNGVNVAGLWRFFTEPYGKSGSHTFLATYANGQFTSLDPNDWVIYPPGGIIAAGERTGSWFAAYILEQQLWVDRCNPNRNIGFLGHLGYADENTCPFAWTMNAALQSQGLLFGRELDTMGIGYFYNGLSTVFRGQYINPVLGELQGGEFYYNAAITPWLRLTGDLQVIQPAVAGNDTAIVAGLRANVRF